MKWTLCLKGLFVIVGLLFALSYFTHSAYASCTGTYECAPWQKTYQDCYPSGCTTVSYCDPSSDPNCSVTQSCNPSQYNELTCGVGTQVCGASCGGSCVEYDACVYTAPASGCTSDSQCPGCQACSNGTCVDSNYYCNPGQVCSNAVCLNTGPAPTPTPVPSACQCTYNQSCTTSISTTGTQSCSGVYSGSTCVWDNTNACSANCGTCVGVCNCAYTQSCTTSSGQVGTQTCSGSKNSSGTCVYDSTGGCSPNCSTCTANATPTSTPTPTPIPAGTCSASCGAWYCDSPNTCNGGANYQLAQQCSNSSSGATCYNTKCDPTQCQINTAPTATPTPVGQNGSCSASYSVSPSNPSSNSSVSISISASSNNFNCFGAYLDGSNATGGCSSSGAGSYSCTINSGSNGSHSFYVAFGQSSLYPGTSCGAPLSCNSTSFTTGSSAAPTPTPLPSCNTGLSCGACSLRCTLKNQYGSKSCYYTAYTGGGACTQSYAGTQPCQQRCTSGYDCNPNGNVCELDIKGTVYSDASTGSTPFSGAQVVVSVPTLTPTPTPLTPPTPTPTPAPNGFLNFHICNSIIPGSNPCANATCTGPANTCSTNNGTETCPYNRYCANGTCQTNCLRLGFFSQTCTANMCSSPLTCNSGVCSVTSSPTDNTGFYQIWNFAPMNYIVSLINPVGYVASSLNPVNVTLPPSQTVNFHVKQGIPVTVSGANVSNQVGTGGLILDTNGDGRCDAGDTNYTGGANLQLWQGSSAVGPVATSKSDGSYTVTGTLSGGSTANLTVSGLSNGYQILGMRYNGAGDCTKYKYTPGVGFPLTFPPNTQNIDILIGYGTPWWQVDSGDVRRGVFNDFVIPSGQKASISTGVQPLFTSAHTLVDLGSGDQINGGEWKASSEYSSYNHMSTDVNGSASYSYYEATANSNGVTINPISCADTSNCNINVDPTSLSPSAQAGVYSLPGGTTITGYTQKANTRVVILVNGDLHIAAPITPGSATDHTMTIFAVKGNIYIDPSVGNSSITDTTTDIRAVLTAEGSIILSQRPDFVCSNAIDSRLVVEGSLIANALHPFADNGTGKVINQRSLCGGNSTEPILLVKQRLTFLTDLTDFYKPSQQKWQEIQP